MTVDYTASNASLLQIPFPVGGGELGELIRAFDWSRTGLGPIAEWPQSLKTVTSMLLQSPVPIVLLWGEDGVMIYNDAYSGFAGGRHPQLLGSKVREGWPEVAAFNDNVMKVGLAGRTLAYKDQELTLYRHGRAEQVWMNLDYSPVQDESGRPAGVIAIVVETSDRIRAERALNAERDRLTTLFEQAPGLMAMLRGPAHIFELANPAYMQLIGHREVIGKPIREALPEVERQGFPALLDDVYRTGRAYVGTATQVQLQRSPDAPLETRVLDFVYQPVTDADGRTTGIFVEGYDITERATAEKQVRASEERFRALVTATSDVIYRMSADWTELQTLDGRGFIPDTDSASVDWMKDYLFPEDQAEVLATVDEAVRKRGVFQMEHRVRRVDGSAGWTFSRAVPIFGESGEILEWFGAASDVTERHKAEERLRLVINELNHRVKNNLAMTQAIAAQTFRRSADLTEAQANFTARILALAQANDLLTGERWVGASLRGILEQAVRPHCSDEAHRCVFAGPEVHLSPKTALSLSIAMHELATNALKYGAWSTLGTVAITWRIYAEVNGSERLHMEWRESGGPTVTPPKHRGFGSRLIERGLAAEMGGNVKMLFEPDGLVCTVDAPLTFRAGE